MIIDNTACLCGSGQPYGQCCGPLLTGSGQAATAEALMRSRYTAYCTGDTSYVLRTWHPSTRPSALDIADQPQWCGLSIVRTAQGGHNDEQGMVEFVASALVGNRLCQFRENSRFVKEDGQWFYVDGDVASAGGQQETGSGNIGRNDACPCGSGRKFKKCCGR
jgi:SEC-C motif-containing protein